MRTRQARHTHDTHLHLEFPTCNRNILCADACKVGNAHTRHSPADIMRVSMTTSPLEVAVPITSTTRSGSKHSLCVYVCVCVCVCVCVFAQGVAAPLPYVHIHNTAWVVAKEPARPHISSTQSLDMVLFLQAVMQAGAAVWPHAEQCRGAVANAVAL